ncbi:anaerobic ribonucleoside-triphosphate reductase activating protein [Methanoculleus sp. Wushi-C6]|uniref:Anaerobic ribonucleoside-triphosphate reductase activating protein n=1 Tax=Methanoculleus caldifontis TaxID=2651577 RepID=A0ABU3X3C9_9EURY|nr:anaerobic ribonucleoside-triphosphate reductase activating protein [Methanoculleus sp. Wushi-C6]MDV2482568.1 anaerobic ribonucleoside-triphosphate reductase activating protein [Methanoculleus sp. Wushi-C6]
MKSQNVNFGGFVPISTVDWRGRAACTVFLRGCPARCFYCHNLPLQGGEDLRPLDEVVAMIRGSRMLAGAVVFSGGEPTLQGAALVELAAAARAMRLSVGLHTNGIFPRVIEELLERHLVDMIALDIKTTWERYDDLLEVAAVGAVQQSLAACRRAKAEGSLETCEIVVTLFRGREGDLPAIAKATRGLDLVLQQGVAAGFVPLSRRELEAAAAPLGRNVRIRTREDGEVGYGPGPDPSP